MEEGMTNQQFQVILEMIEEIIDGSKNKEEALKKIKKLQETLKKQKRLSGKSQQDAPDNLTQREGGARYLPFHYMKLTKKSQQENERKKKKC